MEFSFSDKNPAAPVAYASLRAMNTVVEIVVVHLGETHARTLCDRVAENIADIENHLSRHIATSDLGRINAERRAVKVDDTTYMILELCEVMRKATGGYFDIAALSQTTRRPAYTTDPASHTVTRTADEIVIDLGAFAKGYAADEIIRMFAAEGATSALVNLGNSSIASVGTHPFGDCWPVEIGANGFKLRGSSLSVSGISPGGKAHIIDPLTGRAVDDPQMVAVSGKSAMICEVLSTALYAAPRDQRNAIISQFENYTFTTI